MLSVLTVIPAQAGIQCFERVPDTGFAGMTEVRNGSYGFVTK